LGAQATAPEAIYDAECDVFSPNAAGGVLNDETIPRLRCRSVVGGANEQLLLSRHGDALAERGILYAPDYVANAGGLLSLLFEIGETDEPGVIRRVQAIGERLAEVWARAKAENVPPQRMADRIVEERLADARARKKR
jgi:leucine dehydrogenase